MQLLWELAEIVLYNDEVLDREWQEQSTSLYNFFFFPRIWQQENSQVSTLGNTYVFAMGTIWPNSHHLVKV